MGLSSACQSIVNAAVAQAFANAVLRYGGGREKTYSATATGGSTTIDLTNGNSQVLTLNASTTLTLTGATSSTSCTLSLHVVQDGTGGRTITWPAGVKWPGGTAPTLSTAASAHDLVVLETYDGGTVWYGNLAGLGYA
jgi:hypothetical protein